MTFVGGGLNYAQLVNHPPKISGDEMAVPVRVGHDTGRGASKPHGVPRRIRRKETIHNAKQFVEQVGGYDVITSCITVASPFALAIKRIFDIVGGLIGSLLTLIVLAVVGPMIKRASPGPILYKSERIGRNGKRFKMYKIRSMYPETRTSISRN